MKTFNKYLKSQNSIVIYNNLILGKTSDGFSLNFEPGIYESRVKNIGNKAISKIISNSKITVSVTLHGIINKIAKFNEEREVVFKEYLSAAGGELIISPINANESCSFRFPKTILVTPELKEKSCSEKGCELVFEVYEDFQGIFMEKHS